MKTPNYLIYIILIIAIIIRVIHLDTTPALNPDEAALGYNAYSLILTGKDEHGITWPLHFKSFGDHKPGGYVYLSIPFIKVFGLTPLAIRFPNLILSILAIYFLYRLILHLTKNQLLSTFSAAVLTINPWHIHFSRGAWESSAALTFIIIGVYFFFKAISQKFVKNFILFIINFVISLYIYHSARIIAPLLALSLVIIYSKFFIKKISKLIIPIVLGIILTLPVLFSFLRNGGTARLGGVGLMADTGPVNRANELINHHGNTKIINRIMHNKRVLYLISWGQKYTSHFELNYLALNGDEVPRSKVPEMGQIHLIELPFLFLGLIYLIKDKIFNRKQKVFIISFLLISPIASSLTFQAPSALRSLPMVIPITILISLGLYKTYIFLQKYFILRHSLNFLSAALILSYIFFIAYYFDAYFFHYSKRYPFAWQYQFDKLVPYLESQKNNYKNIYITDKYDQPYILFLFFSKYNPKLIQSQIKLTTPDKYGFSTVLGYDNYHFGKIEWDNIPAKSLIIASDEIVPLNPIKIINFSNNQPAFKIYLK